MYMTSFKSNKWKRVHSAEERVWARGLQDGNPFQQCFKNVLFCCSLTRKTLGLHMSPTSPYQATTFMKDSSVAPLLA